MIKIEPDGPKGYIDRGWVFVLNNDLDKAEADFDKALELHQNDPSALVGRGVVKSRKGKPTDGTADLSLAAARARHFRRDQEARRRVAAAFHVIPAKAGIQ